MSIDLEAIKARAEAATPVVFIGVPMRKENIEFFEHAKGDVDDLLAEVERLNAELKSENTQPKPDGKCREDDGCPTENAVLRREWRKLTARLASVTAERDTAVEDLRKNRARKCDCCAYAGRSERWPCVDCQSSISNYGDGWKWRGAGKEQNDGK